VPRPYRLGRRAEQQAETRDRILGAAVDLYRTLGYAGTTTKAVAHAADVAPATVRNHFATPEALAAAAGARILDDLRPPDPAILDGDPSLASRVARLAVELVAYFERGDPWWPVLQRDPELAAAWAGVAEAAELGLVRLFRAALGPLADDAVAMAVTRTTIGPPLHYMFLMTGMSRSDAVEAQLDVVIPWLERRLALRDPAAPQD
jgi:AcrR family transcriptional regulator